jgi:hypothetical protein
MTWNDSSCGGQHHHAHTLPLEANTHHPQLMRIFTDEHRPVLRWIWVVIDALSDHLAQPRVLGEPLPGQSADGMPANLDVARLRVMDGLRDGHDIGRLAKAGRALEGQLAFRKVLLPVQWQLSVAATE